MTRLAVLKRRLRKKRSGSIGSRVYASRRTNAAISARPTPSFVITSTEPQSFELVSIKPQTKANSPAVARTVPATSSARVVGSLDSGTMSQLTAMAATPTGTLIQKTLAQPALSTRSPPTSGPMASPKAEVPAQIPRAIGSLRGGNAATMIDSDRVIISAPPAPWTARPATSWLSVCDSAQAAELTVKMASPTRKRRRRPNRSPILPPSKVSDASPSEKALMVHSSDCSVAFRFRWMEGRATVTTVMSSITMNRAKTMDPRTSQWRSSEAAGAAGDGREGVISSAFREPGAW
jgi:hypothetical protein